MTALRALIQTTIIDHIFSRVGSSLARIVHTDASTFLGIFSPPHVIFPLYNWWYPNQHPASRWSEGRGGEGPSPPTPYVTGSHPQDTHPTSPPGPTSPSPSSLTQARTAAAQYNLKPKIN
ncbi:hypothetical protein D9758_011229 [Tetrapyrgos nigripes]|uniref:Uncharacterized protein n=1 Tax=Tetrapyrgos nigripes TaxID=182062 RepID=A0A8H5FZD2_9AGAR|nr:hypothetical protein D9758_011229 [Tetrapyrgos nigripes]